jgi:hypothetical protein
MAHTITLNQIKILGYFVDIVNQKVTVSYTKHDTAGTQWGETQVETYWVTLPPNPGPSDVKLPGVYVATLTELYQAALSALTNKYA